MTMQSTLFDDARMQMNDSIELTANKTFSEHWSPRIVTQFNGHDVMVVKLKGEFVWHAHPDTDDFFLVLNGEADDPTARWRRPPRPGRPLCRPKGRRAPPCGARRGAPLVDRADRNPEHG